MADKDPAVTALEEQIAKLSDELEGVNNKYKGAMDDLKKAQREVRAAKEITPEALQAESERADKAEAALADAKKQVAALTTERDKATKALESESQFTNKLLVQDGLKSQLIAGGVKDEDFLDALSAKFAPSAKVIAEGDARKVMFGDKELSAAVTEYLSSDAGKKFVAAPATGGGGAPGGGGSGGAKAIPSTEFNSMSAKDRAAHMASGGTVVDQAA